MINIVHGAENGHTDGNPASWAGQTWLFPVSINAAGPTMYCVHPPLGLDFASVIHCQCSVWRWSLWRQSADLQPQAWEAPSKDFVSPDHVIVILSSSFLSKIPSFHGDLFYHAWQGNKISYELIWTNIIFMLPSWIPIEMICHHHYYHRHQILRPSSIFTILVMRSPNRDEIWEAQALIVVRDAAQQGEDTPGRGCEPLFFTFNRSKL